MKKIKDLFRNCCVKCHIKMEKLKNDVRGMGTIEVVLICAVLVALALLFKVFITKYAGNIFDNIDSKTNDALKDW